MRNVTGVPVVEAAADDSLAITLDFSDGTREQIACTREYLHLLVLRLSAVSTQQLKHQSGLAEKVKVFAGPGDSQVVLQVPTSEGTGLMLAMGHQQASSLGRRLLDAAKASTRQPPRKQ